MQTEPSQRKEEPIEQFKRELQNGRSGVDANPGASLGTSDPAAQTLSTETEAGPKGQTGTQVSVLHALRADLRQRDAPGGLEPGASQWRSPRRRWSEHRTGREVGRRGGTVSGRNRTRASPEDVSAPASPAGVYPQGQREAETAGHSDGSRPGRPDGSVADSGADL